jgi:hypothetical protein
MFMKSHALRGGADSPVELCCSANSRHFVPRKLRLRLSIAKQWKVELQYETPRRGLRGVSNKNREPIFIGE